MYLAKNLRHLRLKYGFSQEFIAERFGYKSYSTVQKWEMGISEPSLSILGGLAELYNIDIDTIYKTDLESGATGNDIKVKKIPLIGTIAAGVPLMAEENIEDYFNLDNSIDADFALKVKGNSMTGANILPNDIVFLRKQCELENGEIGAILIHGEATLKRFYKNDNTIILQAENDSFNPMIIKSGDIHVLGKLVAVISKR